MKDEILHFVQNDTTLGIVFPSPSRVILRDQRDRRISSFTWMSCTLQPIERMYGPYSKRSEE